MPCCTYLNQDEFKQPTSNKVLNDLLSEVRESTGDDWRLEEVTVEERKWWFKTVEHKVYVLYNHVHGPEFQVINFYHSPLKGDNSINFCNDDELVAAYLLGLLAGISLTK